MEFILEKLKDKKIIAIIFLIFLVSIYLIFSYFHSSTIPYAVGGANIFHIYFPVNEFFFFLLFISSTKFIWINIYILFYALIVIFYKFYKIKKIIYYIFFILIFIMYLMFLLVLLSLLKRHFLPSNIVFAYIDYFICFGTFFLICFIPFIPILIIDKLLNLADVRLYKIVNLIKKIKFKE